MRTCAKLSFRKLEFNLIAIEAYLALVFETFGQTQLDSNCERKSFPHYTHYSRIRHTVCRIRLRAGRAGREESGNAFNYVIIFALKRIQF